MIKRTKTESRKNKGSKNEWMRTKLMRKGGFGINEVIGIAAGIIIAAVVIIPGLKEFSGGIMTQLTSWWASLATDIFQG